MKWSEKTATFKETFRISDEQNSILSSEMAKLHNDQYTNISAIQNKDALLKQSENSSSRKELRNSKEQLPSSPNMSEKFEVTMNRSSFLKEKDKKVCKKKECSVYCLFPSQCSILETNCCKWYASCKHSKYNDGPMVSFETPKPCRNNFL